MKESILHTRSKQLHRLALAALPHYPIEVAEIVLLQDEWNTIFQINAADGDRYALRISRPHIYTAPEVRSEAAWMNAVGRDLALPLPRVIPTRSGDLVRTVLVPGVEAPHHAVLFSWMAGVDLAQEMTAENFARFGRLAARLHRHGAAYEPPAGFTISTSDGPFHPRDEALLLTERGTSLMAVGDRPVFEKAVALATDAVNRRFNDPEPARIIHADLHQWNVRILDDALIPFDFEDLTWSYPIQDIATTFYHLHAHPDRQTLQLAFRSGYESIVPWPEAYPGELERFTIRRILDLANFMVGSPDPEDQAAAPPFLTAAAARLRPLTSG